MKDLRGANAILTGASRGLGLYIADALANEGVNLALAARSADALEEVRATVVDKGVDAVVVPTDVGDPSQIDALVDRAEQDLGPIDILINNAGLEAVQPYETYPPEKIEALVRVNLLAPMLLTRRVLPGMLARRRGHIVNIASLAGKTVLPYEAPYSATKAGLVAFTHTLRAELVDSPVGCSAVCPGFVSEAGMYADMQERTSTRLPVPAPLITSSPRKVAAAVIKAIKRDASELIVNPSPMRPLVAMSQLFPDAVPRVLKVFGVTGLARRAASSGERDRPEETR